MQGRADLVAAVLLNGVALSTSCLEKVGTLLEIAWLDELATEVGCVGVMQR